MPHLFSICRNARGDCRAIRFRAYELESDLVVPESRILEYCVCNSSFTRCDRKHFPSRSCSATRKIQIFQIVIRSSLLLFVLERELGNPGDS